MKKISTILALILGISGTSIAAPSALEKNAQRKRNVAAYYQTAEAAFARGDKKATVDSLRKALQLDPNHGPSRALVRQLRKSGPSFKIKAKQRQLSKVIVPVVDFENTSLADALSTLGTVVEEKTQNKVTPNFVIQDPSNALQQRTVTLNMKNVPATVVLDYLMNLTHAKASFAPYAITVRPLPKK